MEWCSGLAKPARMRMTKTTVKALARATTLCARCRCGRSQVARKKNADGSTSETPTCAVCLCDAEQGDCLRRLPCCHEFHAKCVDRWLVNHTTCPMCKHDVRRGEGRQGR
mmetsp:Transcript_10673/g.39504  ORF Transcript_10673/g.39504 Transcript_10673/m.39504 type:complete len:110 (+) Transcript_10673:769-1098(+)